MHARTRTATRGDARTGADACTLNPSPPCTQPQAIRCMPPGVQQWVWVCDFYGFGVADINPKLAKAFLDISAEHYPEVRACVGSYPCQALPKHHCAPCTLQCTNPAVHPGHGCITGGGHQPCALHALPHAASHVCCGIMPNQPIQTIAINHPARCSAWGCSWSWVRPRSSTCCGRPSKTLWTPRRTRRSGAWGVVRADGRGRACTRHTGVTCTHTHTHAHMHTLVLAV